MKLRTEMVNTPGASRKYPVAAEGQVGNAPFDHDAVAAHALLRAINFVDAYPLQDPVEAKAQRVAIDAIWRMANARMQEWGFGEDEQ
jgi:hypothetical protein